MQLQRDVDPSLAVTMLRRFRAYVAGAMLVLYAGTMLLGQSLHTLLQCEHRLATRGCIAFESGHEHRADGLGGGVSLTGNEISLLSSADADGDHAADCPICRFHSQGQLSAPPSAAIAWLLLPGDAPTPATGACSIDLPGIYQSRAPPQA